jgi:HEAT repeat protein
LLVKELSDNDDYLRKTTAVALGRIGPAARAAVPRLRQLAGTDSDEDVRKAARAAAKKIAPEWPPKND